MSRVIVPGFRVPQAPVLWGSRPSLDPGLLFPVAKLKEAASQGNKLA